MSSTHNVSLFGRTVRVSIYDPNTLAARGFAEAAAASAASIASSASLIDRHSLDLGLPVTATNLVPLAGSVSPSRIVSFNYISGATYTLVYRLRANPIRYAQALLPGFVNLLVDLVDGTVILGPGGFANIATYTLVRQGAFWLWTITFTANATDTDNLQLRPTGTGELPYTANGTDGLLVQFASLTTGGGSNLLPNSTMLGAGWDSTSLATPAAVTPTTTDADLLGQRFNETEAQSAATAVRVLGTMTATRVTEASGSDLFVRLFRFVTIPSGDTFRFEVEAKRGELKRLTFFSNAENVFDVDFDLAAGTATGSGASIDTLDNGWYRCVYQGVSASATGSNWQVQIQEDDGTWPYDGDGSSGLFLHRVKIRNVTKSIDLLNTTDWSTGWTLTSATLTANAALFGGLPFGLANAHPLAGRKVAVLGTSLVEQDFWTSAFAARTGCTLINLGESGCSYGLSSDYVDSRIGFCTAQMTTGNIPADTALIIADAPVNDPFWRVPVGTVSDTTTATFAGAMANISIWAATNRASTAVMYVQLPSAEPTYATHRHGGLAASGLATVAPLEDYQNMLARIARREGRPLVDLNDFGISWRTAGIRGDGLHWNARGGDWIAEILEAETKRLAVPGWLAA